RDNQALEEGEIDTDGSYYKYLLIKVTMKSMGDMFTRIVHKTRQLTKCSQVNSSLRNFSSSNFLCQEIPSPKSVTPKFNELFINNEFVKSENGKVFPVISPINEIKISDVYEASQNDVNNAVSAAHEAGRHGNAWSKVTPTERGHLLNKLADLIQQNKTELASLETINNGKLYNNAYNVDVNYTADCYRYYAGWANKICGKTNPDEGTFSMTLKEPIGVCAQIIPWNFPLLMQAWKLGPALCTGNTIVMKTAEQTPLTALYIADLIKQAGFPPGVVNILNGYVEKAVDACHTGVFFNEGQCCCAGTRVFVQENMYDQFVERMIEKVNKGVVGNPLKLETNHGPLVDKNQFTQVMEFIQHGKKGGADLLAGGTQNGEKGYYINPTVFGNVSDDMRICKEEIFGPVMSILKFKTEEEVIARANNSNYGLAAGVQSENFTKALRVGKQLKAGTVWINCYNVLSVLSPFGGYKDSGVGRELGKEGLKNYCQTKSVIILFHQN
ncbi:hypothetical protein A3Q56_02808, partial [Intoshia linei]